MSARVDGGSNQTVCYGFDSRERELFDPSRVYAALVRFPRVAVSDVEDVDGVGGDVGEAVEERDGLWRHEAVGFEHEGGELIVGVATNGGVVGDLHVLGDGGGVTGLVVSVTFGFTFTGDGVREGYVDEEAVVGGVDAAKKRKGQKKEIKRIATENRH